MYFLPLHPHGNEMDSPKNNSLLFEIKCITSFSTFSIVILKFFDFICFCIILSEFSYRVTLLKLLSELYFLKPLFNPFALTDLS